MTLTNMSGGIANMADGSITLINNDINATDNQTDISTMDATHDIVFNGGTYNMGDIKTSGGSIVFNSGDIHATQVWANGGDVIIQDGVNLTIEGGDQYSWLQGKTVQFLGGTTIINSISIGLVVTDEGIVYGEGVCVNKINSMSYGFDTNNIWNTNDGQMASVTVNKGACINPEGDPTGGNGPKAPNTGFEASQAILATIIALPSLVAAAILGRFFYKRYNQRVSFKK